MDYYNNIKSIIKYYMYILNLFLMIKIYQGKLYNSAVSKVAYEMFVDEKKKELKEASANETDKKTGDAKDDKTSKKEKDKAMKENIRKMWEELSEEQQQKYEDEVKANKLVSSKGKIKPKPKQKAKVKKVAKKAISKEKNTKKETKEKVKKSIEKAKGTKAKKEVCINIKMIVIIINKVKIYIYI